MREKSVFEKAYAETIAKMTIVRREEPLLPCPFCESDNVENDACGPFDEPGTAWVVCCNCGASGPQAEDSSDTAKALWNKAKR